MEPHRKTMKRREREGDARYLTFSCVHRLPLFERDWVRLIFLKCLAACRDRTGFRLFAWVIMPEHVHLLLRPSLPDWPLDRVLWRLKRESGKRIVARWRDLRDPILPMVTGDDGRVRFWQPGGGYDRNVFSGDEFWEKRRYIHLNPVRRRMVARSYEWPWSSAMAHALDVDVLTPREVLEAEWLRWDENAEWWKQRLSEGEE